MFRFISKLINKPNGIFLLMVLLLVPLYFLTHIWKLTSLPVFADESIYIRWAQLILDDPSRYFFFALNDGKTPLFIWFLTPVQLLFQDQLWAGRIVSVFIGFFQIIALGLLTRELGGKSKAQSLVMTLGTVLPFWFLHHRLALIDGLLCLFLTLCLLGLIKMLNQPLSQPRSRVPWAAFAGLCFGLAFWTKVPAVLFLPVALLWSFWPRNKNLKELLHNLLWVSGVIVIGLVIFGLLRISPAFGQLFSRGSDFLFPFSEVLAGKWRETIPSVSTYFGYFVSYAHPVILALFGISLFSKRHLKAHHLLFWSALLFALPMIIMGRVVYARYFMPVMIFMTIGSALYWEELFETHAEAAKSLIIKSISGIILALSMANVLGFSLNFMMSAWFRPNQLPLVASDKVQYLTEWSSGHGIYETYQFIVNETEQGKVAIATEGFFGTLPDALLMYLHRQPNENLYLEGIGQPVAAIPESFVLKTTEYPQKYLIVNSHRMKMSLPRTQLVRQFCRPYTGPCLQIWDISQIPSATP